MNIYLHVETSIRELDSKILLATLAASRGHNVIVSDIEGIEKGIKRGVLAPGIYHTKSLSPVKYKIARHKMIIDKGNFITSIDEENGLIEHGYEKTAKMRYSEQTIEDASAIFGWGSEDGETLKNIYPKYSSKIHCTGSPRVDLWKSVFSNYWSLPASAPKRPYLLVASNMSMSNYILPFYHRILNERERGHYERDPKLFLNNFGLASENFKITAAFIEAMQHLTKQDNGYDIVFRPHPNEDIKAWKVYLDGVPNLHVIREGSITGWLHNAFAVMHNGCTTALEATVSNKPLLTFVPFKQQYDNKLSNELGIRVETKEELLSNLNAIFSQKKFDENKDDFKQSLPDQISKKIYIDKDELSSVKIIKVWESLVNENSDLSRSSNWFMYRFLLKIMKFNGIIGRSFGNFSKNHLDKNQENFKFPPLNKHDISERINKFKSVLEISKKIECKLLSDRTVLIKPNEQ